MSAAVKYEHFNEMFVQICSNVERSKRAKKKKNTKSIGHSANKTNSTENVMLTIRAQNSHYKMEMCSQVHTVRIVIVCMMPHSDGSEQWVSYANTCVHVVCVNAATSN